MIRSLMVILILIVVFLVGALFGSERGKTMPQETHYSRYEPDDILYTIDKVSNNSSNSAFFSEPSEHSIINDNENTSKSKPIQFTQRIASFLEFSIKGFYEMVVGILYSLSSIFF